MAKWHSLAILLMMAAFGASQTMVLHQKGGGVIRAPISEIQKIVFQMPTTYLEGDGLSLIEHLKIVTANIIPNPFNPTTTIGYTTNTAGHVTIHLIDMAGKVVRVLENAYKPGGCYSVTWDGKSDNGARVSSGTYIAQIKSGAMIISKKAILLK